MSYEHFLNMEREGRAAYQLGDTNCSDCNQPICACESLSEWIDDVNPAGAVCVPPPAAVHSFPEWLEKHNDHLHLPESFQEWLDQGDDAIRQANRREAYLDQGHLHT